MLGKTLAASLGKKVGQTLTLYDAEDFRVVGVFESTTVYENGGMLLLLPVLQRIMGREGQVTGFTLSLQERASQEALDRACREIRQLDKNLEPMPTEQYVNSTNEIRFVRAMAWLTSAVALVIGTVGVLNTMIMSVYERTREIGILRAIGWRRSRVVRMILSESIVLSVAGGMAGALAAILLTRCLSTFRAVAGVVEGHIDLATIGQGFLIALLVGVIGAAYPAYRGALLPPTEALRHE
jgi:putative ABC transport system permease protein